MAKRLREKKIDIDLIISSPAKRAARTAKAFAEELNVKKKRISFTIKTCTWLYPMCFLESIYEIEVAIPNQTKKLKHTILLTEKNRTVANLFKF